MKTIVMMRGPDPKRTEVAQGLLRALNPDVDTVRGAMISAHDWMGRGGDNDASAAYTTCKNYLRKFLAHGNEAVLIVNNPNEKPDTWRSYRRIAASFPEASKMVGVDVEATDETFRKEVEFHFGPDATIEQIMERLA